MSFNFSDVKKFASKLKESVSSNVTLLLQNSNSGNNVSSSIKNGINGVIQSVKTGSMAVGAKIVQTKDSLLTKTNEVIDVVIAPCQIKYIVDNLEKNFNDTCYVKNSIQLDNCIIPHGFVPYTIQGVLVESLLYQTIIDILYMLRSHSCITLQFSNSNNQHSEKDSCINIFQCMLFLLPYYDSFISLSTTTCRRAVVSNHYLTIRCISKINNSVDLFQFLNPNDLEHLLVVDRLFIQCLRTSCPRPFIQLPNDEKAICQVEDIDHYLEMIPRHLISLVDCLFRFCQVIYDLFHIFPSTELMSILCIGKNQLFFTSLILQWSSHHSSLESEFFLAYELAHMINPLYFYEQAGMIDFSRVTSIANSISLCHSADQVREYLQQSQIPAAYSFSALLRRLNLCLLPDWISHMMQSVMKQVNDYQRLISARYVISLIPSCYRSILYWLLRCAMISSQQDKVFEAIGMFWFPQRCMSMITPFLQYAIQHLYFLFIPDIPSLSACEDSTQDNQNRLVDLSLSHSFSSMHSTAPQNPQFSSDIEYLDSLLSSYHCDEYIMKDRVVWAVPTHFLGLQLVSVSDKPALPPKPIN